MAGLFQLVNDAQQHVELADGSKAFGDSAKATAELVRNHGIQLQDRQHLAEAAGRHPSPVQSARVTAFEAL